MYTVRQPESHGGVGALPRAGDEGENIPGLHVQLLLALPLRVRYSLFSALTEAT
jgi:hypothetical protein